MGDLPVALLVILVTTSVSVLLGLIGLFLEKGYEAKLAGREAALGAFLILDLDTVPGMAPTAGQLVSGNVVMGTGYLKQFAASLRNLVGGEIKGYQRVLDLARREAQLRMVEAAVALGAQAIVNVRFETSDVGGAKPFSEVFCYGTMVK